jgi:hypothetical protein
VDGVTTQSEVLTDLLGKRKDRAIGIVLGVKERECDRFLPPEVSKKLRKVVLDQLNEFHDLCLDVMRSLDDGDVVLNERYFEMLAEVHNAVVGNGNGRH